MNLLRTWWAPIRARLIDDARLWWRFWSMRFAALGFALEAFLGWFPDRARDVWTWLPADMRALLPSWLTTWLPILLFGAVMISRVVAQKKGPTNG
jgi:hypothetical protein